MLPVPWRRPAVAAALLLLVAGCRESPSGDGPVTLRFVSWKPTQPVVWNELLRRFEESHPGTRLERQVGPHSSTAFHDLVTQKLRNHDPAIDVFFMDVVWVAEMAAAGWARPLDERFPASERARFLEGAIRANTWNGRVWGVPAFVDAGMLYYRKDLLEKHGVAVPDTWEELEAAARAIVAAEGDRDLVGYTAQLKQYEGLVCNLLELIAARGGHLIDAGATRSTLLEPPALAAVRFARDRIVGGIAPRAALTWEEPESLAVFLQGHAVFHRNWPYAWEVSNDSERSRVTGKVGLAPLPRFEGGERAAALGGWQYGISAFSQHPDEAWAFVEYMTSAETQRFLAVEASLAPTRTALYDDETVLARNPRFADQAASFRAAVPRPVTPAYPAVSNVLQRYFSSALADPESDVEALAKTASEEIDRLLALVRK